MFFTFFSQVLIWHRLKILTYKYAPKFNYYSFVGLFNVIVFPRVKHGPVMMVKSDTTAGISVDARAGSIETKQGPNWEQLNQQQDLAKVTNLCSDSIFKNISESLCCICFFCCSKIHVCIHFSIGSDKPQPFRTPCFGGSAPNPAPRPPCSGGQPRI